MSNETADIHFDVDTRFQGADVFLSDGSKCRVAKNRLDISLFRDIVHKSDLSTRQMLGAFLAKQGAELRDYMEPEGLAEAIDKGTSRGKPPLEIRIGNRAFKFRSKGKWVDFDRLLFDVEFIYRPRRSS